MKALFILYLLVVFSCVESSTQGNNVKTMGKESNYNALTEAEKYVIESKGTERPFTGKYYKLNDDGIYTCKKCGFELFSSDAKFNSGCGWPSFDEAIGNSVQEIPDADGVRTEIVCSNCGAHLGHVFKGEGFTEKNTRHCVNSISLQFVPEENQEMNIETDTAIFASGCFWGTQYYMQKADGVLSTSVGYTGGEIEFPTYEQVCTGTTGHAEAVQVVFDSKKISFEDLTKLFFETHDPTQIDRQGPDIGEQYRSEIFYMNEEQKEISQKLKNILVSKGYQVATKITKAGKFWDAEEYHQDYYLKKNGIPYCHFYKKKF